MMARGFAAQAMTVPGRTMTADELFLLPDDNRRYALVRGKLHSMAPAGFDHGAVVVNLTIPLGRHVRARRLGVVCGAETGFVLETDPDTVLAPDAAFVRGERIPASGRPAAFWRGAPDLAVEVTSPGDTRAEVARKVRWWLSSGAGLVWVADPGDRSVTAHAPGRAPRRFGHADTLDGAPLLPDFALPVADVFAL